MNHKIIPEIITLTCHCVNYGNVPRIYALIP